MVEEEKQEIADLKINEFIVQPLLSPSPIESPNKE